jgi:hypothetical protein
MGLIPEVLDHLCLQSDLQHPLRQLGQQTVRPDQICARGLGLGLGLGHRQTLLVRTSQESPNELTRLTRNMLLLIIIR